MKTEELIRKLQEELQLNRVEVLLLLANTLAEGLLSTQANVLDKTFQSQHNRLALRKLNSVFNTLSKLNYLRFKD